MHRYTAHLCARSCSHSNGAIAPLSAPYLRARASIEDESFSMSSVSLFVAKCGAVNARARSLALHSCLWPQFARTGAGEPYVDSALVQAVWCHWTARSARHTVQRRLPGPSEGGYSDEEKSGYWTPVVRVWATEDGEREIERLPSSPRIW